VDGWLSTGPTIDIIARMVTPSVHSLLDEQAGVATRQQLRSSGVRTDQIKAQIDAHRRRSLNEVVVCTHNGPLTTDQARWAAVLAAQGVVALRSLTALECHGVAGFETSAVHVAVARGARVIGVKGVETVAHESRRFSAADVLPRRPPITTVERATIDAAAWSQDQGTATRVVTAAIQQRRTTAARLRKELTAAGNVKFRGVLLPFIADLEGGAQALSEVDFLRWCRRHGFPKPQLNVRIDHLGRRRYHDATFRTTNGRTLYVEIDGGVHLTLTTRWHDTAKDNDAMISGQATLRFPSIAIYSNDPIAIRQLSQALGSCQRYKGL
jgi:hypothetical protein